jgi:2-hydroxy-3-keto-5-methylthiopentenyl-1-phosphate phosphatase
VRSLPRNRAASFRRHNYRHHPPARRLLLDSIEVDEGFALLLDTRAAGGISVHIVSDGFDYCIRRIISRPRLGLGSRLEGVRVFASRLEPDGRRGRADFPHPRESCVHGCATCKPSVMAMLEREGRTSVFAGDGLSDRYAAAAADLVFAKGALAAHCRERRKRPRRRCP